MSPSSHRAQFWVIALLALGIAIALFSLGSSIYISTHVTRSLENLQREINTAKVASVLQALDQNAQALVDFTTGYSMWDDTYKYLENPTAEYVERNYSPDVLSVTPVQLVVLYDLKGNIVLSTAVDEDYKPITVPSDVNMLHDMEPFAGLKKSGDYFARVEWMSGHPYLITVCPVTDSLGEAPVRGYLLFGSVIGGRMLQRIERLTGIQTSAQDWRNELPGAAALQTSSLGNVMMRIDQGSDLSTWTAQALFPEDNVEQASTLFRMALPVSAAATGLELGRMIRADLLLVAVAFVVFGGLVTREVRTRQREVRRGETERDYLLAAQRKAELEAREAAASERAQSTFLATMSHEIRTPLNAIVGFADLPLEDVSPAELRERLRIIGKSSGVLRHILNDILDFTKIESGQLTVEKRPVQIRPIIHDVVDSFGASALEHNDVTQVEIAKNVPDCLVLDEVRFKQVLGNLISNAVKFTSNGTIRVEGTFQEAVGGKSAMLTMDVADEGVGVSSNQEFRLFEPFAQGDESPIRRFEGTGLGLAISRRLCELMGGEIAFRRGDSTGSTFSFSLPVEVSAVASSLDASSLSTFPFKADNLSILVVDDHKVNARLVVSVLKRFGTTAEIATSGEGAVSAFARQPFDLVFMDIHMPGIDGLEAARRIREFERVHELAGCTIIALSADVLVNELIVRADVQIDGCISKPFTSDQVGDVLRQVISRRG